MDAETQRKPPKPATLDLLVIALAGTALRLTLSASMRLAATKPGAPILWMLWLATGGLALLLVWQFLHLWRRRESWALYLGAALLFVLTYRLGNRRPEIAPLELPLAILLLAPAALLIWAFVRQVRGADELQRRILLEALAIAFAVEFTAAIAFALLESFDVPRPPSVLWAALLVMSWSVGLAVASRRYA
jgi:hypothetical protein